MVVTATNYSHTHNLHLLGTPDENACLQKIARSLPVEFTQKAFCFAGKKYPLATHGLRMIYPNPLTLRNYVLLDIFPPQTGDLAPVVERLIPDYLVYSITDEKTTVKDEGFFSAGWER